MSEIKFIITQKNGHKVYTVDIGDMSVYTAKRHLETIMNLIKNGASLYGNAVV